MSGDQEFAPKYLNQQGILEFLNEHSGTREASVNRTEFTVDLVKGTELRRNPFLVEHRYPVEHRAFDLTERTIGWQTGKDPVVIGSIYVETGEYQREGWKPMEYDFLDFRLDCSLKLLMGLSLPKLHIELFAQRTTEFVPIDIERRDRVPRKIWLFGFELGWKRKTLEGILPDKIFLPDYFQTNPDRYLIRNG